MRRAHEGKQQRGGFRVNSFRDLFNPKTYSKQPCIQETNCYFLVHRGNKGIEEEEEDESSPY